MTTERFESMLNGVSFITIEVDGFVDMRDPCVSVAIVYDSSSFTPQGALYITSLSEHVALEEAFNALETSQVEQLSTEEHAEYFKNEEYNTLTEGYDGRSFVMAPYELEKILNNVTNNYTSEIIKSALIEFYREE